MTIWVAQRGKQATGSPVYVCTAGNVAIVDNVFVNPAPCPVTEPRRGTIGASHSQRLRVLNNRWEGEHGRAGVLYDPATTRDVECAGNQARPGTAPAGEGGK